MQKGIYNQLDGLKKYTITRTLTKTFAEYYCTLEPSDFDLDSFDPDSTIEIRSGYSSGGTWNLIYYVQYISSNSILVRCLKPSSTSGATLSLINSGDYTFTATLIK